MGTCGPSRDYGDEADLQSPNDDTEGNSRDHKGTCLTKRMRFFH